MSQFSLLLSRLVDLLGAETAAQVVREFAGQTLQFPITDHYGSNQATLDAVSARATSFGERFKAAMPKPRTPHAPLTEAEAIEISHRLLATVRKCCAPFQTKTLPAAESQVMDASCTTHPDQCTAPLHIPAAVPPSSEQEPHMPLVAQPESLSFPQSIDRS